MDPRQFQSLREIELELKKKDLERQISREQIRQHGLLLKQHWARSVLTSTLVKTVSKIGVQYLIKRLTK
ncbi:MAG TPA: hypothetical protein PKW08_02495 [Flavobacteriaceae bacterium]|nr:hypothetical protein [Flavobacteriaceae bacterium]MCB9212249.1 hypothetical protein [Alteromonas sp.]HPF10372.1 hypothetical protein [Flavobacteriaceae bacterium]HQU20436.1 hypothetical protein [Flavobacteriaceae bacterium]HQU66539.1 hypothetical protein [Flavobacteriaceae bacterium]